MKRSQMIEEIEVILENMQLELFGNCVGCRSYAEKILENMEEAGMLPPTQSPSLIPDTLNGGLKHGPALRVWDEETS